jgi:uncharacterized RDD family membrane protein YckC
VAAWGGVAVPSRATQARQARTRRFGALVVDLIIFSILQAIVSNVYGVTVVTSGTPPTGGNGFFSIGTVTTIGWLGLTVLWLAYYIVQESLFGASAGMMLFGLCVVRVDGRPLSVGAIVVRNLMRLVDALPALYLIGGASVLLSGHSQRLGDMVAKTTVVAREHAIEPAATRRPAPGSGQILAAALSIAMLFTIAFDYFGRPPLVLQGLFNEHEMLAGDVTSYALGLPSWGPGHVTYPVTLYKGGQLCTGTLQMDWYWTGWEVGNATYACKP